MLLESTAMDMCPVSKYEAIDDRLDTYKENFCHELLRIFHEQKKKSEECPTIISGLENYTVYRNMYPNHKPVKYNNKNIVFETNSNLWDYFKWFLDKKQHPDSIKYNDSCSDIKCMGEDDVEYYGLEEYHNFFGPGEFPIIIFNVIRIGNQEYTFWDISR
jgi:hypothetical protein